MSTLYHIFLAKDVPCPSTSPLKSICLAFFHAQTIVLCRHIRLESMHRRVQRPQPYSSIRPGFFPHVSSRAICEEVDLFPLPSSPKVPHPVLGVDLASLSVCGEPEFALGFLILIQECQSPLHTTLESITPSRGPPIHEKNEAQLLAITINDP